ncbi:MAG: phospholipase D-like domain-containing protein [Burkholderiaceae bacterium]
MLATPYFVPDEGLLDGLRLAATRGVRITLVLPAESNHRLADWARGRAVRTLVEAGAQVRLVPAMMHAKAVVVDDELALCGSANLDSRSLFINYEASAAFYGTEQIDWLAGWIASTAERGQPASAKPPRAGGATWPRGSWRRWRFSCRGHPLESPSASFPLSCGRGTTPVPGASPSTAFAGLACSAAIGVGPSPSGLRQRTASTGGRRARNSS